MVSEPRGYLLDTNVISETRKIRPHPEVSAFLTSLDTATLYLSVLTLGELRKGVAKRGLIDPTGAKELGAWVDALELGFGDRVLKIDARISRLWGEVSSCRSRPVVDTLLAATAMLHGLVLVTRNTADVQDPADRCSSRTSQANAPLTRRVLTDASLPSANRNGLNGL